MKIATYNVWNETGNLDIRTEQLIQEINKADADIIGLQEVMPSFWENLKECIDYKYCIYRMFESRGDGLAVLSRYPFESDFFLYDSVEFQNSLALNVTFKTEGVNFSLTNVHLPWDSVIAKEKQTVAINEYARGQRETAQYFVLLGDFNCSSQSSVHNFLIGEQSLLGCEANPVWYDLAEVYASKNERYSIAPTLDFNSNPRWDGKDRKYVPVACDRVYLMDNAESGDWGIRCVGVFGTDVSSSTGLCPSDHYGVLTQVDFW